MSFWDEWFKRFGKRSSMFGEFERLMEELEREMAETIRQMEGNMPEEMLRETRRPDGSVLREYSPFVYWYSVKIGPDGKPVIREFGNMKPGIEEERPLSLHERREPLVDVIEDDDSIKVLAELPGVEKQDIKLHATTYGITIDVENAERKYFKELTFPVDIDRSTAKSTYRNGVLEITFRKKREDQGTPISVE
jgi:HSP20 family protein